MKNKLLICLLTVLCHSTIFAQTWTLKQCIKYAEEHNSDLMITEGQRQLAEQQLQMSKNNRLPDLNGSAGQSLDFTQSKDYNTSANSSFSLNASVPVYNGFRLQKQIAQHEIDLKQSTASLGKAKESLDLHITAMYFEVLFKKELLLIYSEQVKLSEAQVKRTQLLVDGGRFNMSQLYETKAQLARDHSSFVSAEQDVALALLNLAQSLNLHETGSFDIVSDILPDILPPYIDDMKAVFTQALNKPQIKEAEYQVQSHEQGLAIAKSYYLPQLSFGTTYSNAYTHVFGGFTNSSFSSQFSSNGRASIGFNLTIPIFNRFQTKGRVQQAQIAIQQSKYHLTNVQDLLYKEVQQAYQARKSAEAKFEASKLSQAAALESYNYVDKRYLFGQATVIEYSEAQSKLTQSKSELLQAKYDYLYRSKIIDFYRGIPLE